jgi:hypothetical protein
MVSVREIGCTASLDKLLLSGYSTLVSTHTHIEKESREHLMAKAFRPTLFFRVGRNINTFLLLTVRGRKSG